MHRIILDRTIIIKYPELLTLNGRDYHPVVTLEILRELQAIKPTSWGKQLADIIEKGHLNGEVSIINPFGARHQALERRYVSASLSMADVSLLAAADSVQLDHPDDEVSIATTDKAVIRFAFDNDIKILSVYEINTLLGKNDKIQKKEPSTLFEAIQGHENSQRWSFWLSLLSALTGVVTSVFTFVNWAIRIKVPIPDKYIGFIIFIFLIALGVFFYYCREKYRLFYGMFELLAGIAVVFLVFSQHDFIYNELLKDVESDFKILGGLYIIVRGMDNIHKGSAGTKMGLWFDRVFSRSKAMS